MGEIVFVETIREPEVGGGRGELIAMARIAKARSVPVDSFGPHSSGLAPELCHLGPSRRSDCPHLRGQRGDGEGQRRYRSHLGWPVCVAYGTNTNGWITNLNGQWTDFRGISTVGACLRT